MSVGIVTFYEGNTCILYRTLIPCSILIILNGLVTHNNSICCPYVSLEGTRESTDIATFILRLRIRYRWLASFTPGRFVLGKRGPATHRI
jgi:hypothetical protein